ncbi:hypothetical protein ZWY2020_034944 [Hordeum vulgare]|nr:hypothetical protein ZWY2020_034944 [Hordeum vulgare]
MSADKPHKEQTWWATFAHLPSVHDAVPFPFGYLSIRLFSFPFSFLFLPFIIILSTISSSSPPPSVWFDPWHSIAREAWPVLRSRGAYGAPGGPATPTPGAARPLRLAEEEVREAELFEDAVDVSPTASAHPVTWREGEAAPSSSPSMSVSIPPRDEAGAADDEEEAYESPPASGASGPPGIDGAGWSPSVSESREGSASPSGQRARGAEEEEEGNWGALSGAARLARDGTRVRSSSAPPSPGPSSSPAPQIRPHPRHVRTSSFQRFRQQMQRAWKGPSGGGGGAERGPREQLLRTTVNIEAMANQKQQWYQIRQGHLASMNSLSLSTMDQYQPWNHRFFSNIHLERKRKLERLIYPHSVFLKGVKARLVERTPSMSDLNEVIFGQEHLCRDDLSFIFFLKVSDNAPLYGVCLHVQEIVQRAPGILGAVSPLNQTSYKPSRFLVSAPRCYCLLTRVPFFELHYEMLNSIISQEKAERITQFASEIALAGPVPFLERAVTRSIRWGFESPKWASYNDWTEYAVPSTVYQNMESRCDSSGRASSTYENGQTSPDLLSMHSATSTRLERTHRSVKGAGSDEEGDEVNVKNESGVDDGKVLGWAKAHNNEPLQIVCGYHTLPLPPHGGNCLQPLNISSLLNTPGLDYHHWGNYQCPLVAAEEALALSIWNMATVCRSLSLESMLALFTGVLLEKQIVVICPKSALECNCRSTVSNCFVNYTNDKAIPVASLLLPVLPRKLIDFIDAPVPFIAGIQHKPPDIKMKASSLVRINVQKDQVKANLLPQLPRYKDLVSDLSPIHSRLSCEDALAKKHPMYKCNEVQAKASMQFLNVLRSYLESLCSELRYHTITNVQSDNDRVSLLLKDSFIDSFPSKDRPFMKLFVETQMFSVLSDSRLATFENEHTQGFASAGDQNMNLD